MKIDTKELRLDPNELAYSQVDPDIKYYLEYESTNIVARSIIIDGNPKGFALCSKAESSFYPANTILQFSIEDRYFEQRNEIWQALTVNQRIDAAFGSTECIVAMSMYLDHYTYLAPLALGFEHGSIIEKVSLPSDFRMSAVAQEQTEEVLSIWKDIYAFFKMDYIENLGDVKRTRDQIRNGDLFALYEGQNAIALGAATFRYATKGKVEIAYAVKPSHWRKGYGTLIAMYLKKACQDRGCNAVAHCNVDHFSSIRVLSKAGMICRHLKMEYHFR